ncbi:MAG: hypothetical protein AAFV80_15035 [Bacteroidota bacterium]
MDYEDILDEQYLRELMEELQIELPETHDLLELPEADAFMIKTFTNGQEANFFYRVLRQAGFPVELENDPTFGNMDPLFNTGTFLLKTKEEYADQAFTLIEKIQSQVEQDRPEMRKRTPQALAIFALLLFGFILLILTLLLNFVF